MAHRSLLHRNSLDSFKCWLVDNNIKIKENKGSFEVLRWLGEKGRPMPIIFDRHGGDHYTCNHEAVKYVRKWLEEKKDD